MNNANEENKRLVLEGFDTLFNKRDYAAAEKFWSPHYIQHSAHIGPGREGLFNLLTGRRATLPWPDPKGPHEEDCGHGFSRD